MTRHIRLNSNSVLLYALKRNWGQKCIEILGSLTQRYISIKQVAPKLPFAKLMICRE